VIQRFLIFASGASYDILKKCVESEKIKFTSIGLTVIMTALFAMISSSYAFYLIFESLPVSIAAGLFWGLMIFNLDRLIISSVTKEDKPYKEIFNALPRIALACIIALVISKPLEVKLFVEQSDNLIEKTPDALPNFIGKLEALNQLIQSSETIKWASIMIMLLFFIIEISPILMRLIIPKGQYDYLLESTSNLQMTFDDKIKAQIQVGNFQDAINSLFFIADKMKDKTLEYKIKKIAIQAKYFEEERKNNAIDEQFAQREYSKIKHELILIANEASKLDKSLLPPPQNLNVNIHELPSEVIEQALRELRVQKNN